MKIKKNKSVTALLCLLFHNLSPIHAAPLNYNELYIFGDSLNEMGHGKSVDAANSNLIQSEIIYHRLFNKKLINHSENGSNYSEWGSEVPELQELYKFKFNKNNIGENNLFYVSIGNNDITTELIKKPIPQLDWNHEIENYNNTITTNLVQIVTELGNNGKNTVIVNTIPDISLTPLLINLTIFPRIDVAQYFHFYYDLGILYDGLFSLYDASNKIINHFDFIAKGLKKIGIYTEKELRAYAATYPQLTADKPIRDYLKSFFLGMYQDTLLGLLPMELFYDHLSTTLQRYTDLYNRTYIEKLLQTNENLVFLDLNYFFATMLQNSAEFGFDNVTISACSSGTFSMIIYSCDHNSQYYDADQNYIFSDLIHPSAYAHQALAAYLISVLSAPVQFSSIALNQISAVENIQLSIQQELSLLADNPLAVKSYRPFINYSFNLNRSFRHQGVNSKKIASHFLTSGILYQTHTNNTLAVMLSLTYGKPHAYQNYRYQYHQQTLALVDQVQLTPNWWVSFEAGYGRTKIKHIKRSIPIHKGTLIETGDTTGYSIHSNLRTGYQLYFNQSQRLTSYFGLTFNRINLNGYKEHNNLATSMQFDKLKFNYNYATIGLTYSNQNSPINFKSTIAYNRALSDKQTAIATGIKKFKPFNRTVQLFDKQWITLNLNFSKQFPSAMTIYTDIGLKHNRKKINGTTLTLGLNYPL